MRMCFLLLMYVLMVSFTGWETDFEKAKQLAVQNHKVILLSFSGSDWCGPCIRLHHDFFENDAFKNYADTGLLLVNADFPRMKKNQLGKEQQKQNDQLADKYNANGSFPFTVLLSADGKVLKSWDGYPKITPGEFVSQLKTVVQTAR